MVPYSALVTLVILGGAFARENGAPCAALNSLRPQHGPNAVDGFRGNFRLTATVSNAVVTSFSAGQRVTVKISGGDVRGFILRAVDAQGFDSGRFDTARLPWCGQFRNCESRKTFITHTRNAQGCQLSFDWIAGNDATTEVIFKATVVQEYHKYNSGIELRLRKVQVQTNTNVNANVNANANVGNAARVNTNTNFNANNQGNFPG